MKKYIKNQDGFGVIEILLVVVVLGLIGFVGYHAYSLRHKATSQTNQSTQTKTATPAPASAYAGWKTYCDSATSGCFRYPSDWDNLSRGTDATALGSNKGETLILEYNEPTNASDGLGDFLTKSVTPLTIQGSSYDLIGGYYTVSNVPGYYLVDASLAQQLGLKAGVTTNITNNDLYFTFDAKKATFVGHYDTAASGGASSIATSTSNAWFSSADGQTALSALKSFNKQ